MKDYHYPNFQPARTLWYHDHGVHWTAQQAYGGLAAMYLLHDRDEQELLPKGDFDVPLMVNDAIFGTDGGLIPKGVAVTSMRHGGAERYLEPELRRVPVGGQRDHVPADVR